MKKITLHYDFDEYTKERDSVKIVCRDYKYEVKLKKSDQKLTVSELEEKYRDKALKEASFLLACRVLAE